MRYIPTILLAAVMQAHAAQPEISVGVAQYTEPPNSVWYQKGFPYAFENRHAIWSVGVVGQPFDWLRLRAGYIDMGSTHNRAWVTADDANYNGINGCNGKCLPLSYIQGESHTKGVYLTAAPETEIGNYKVFVEGGAWLYKVQFTMHVPLLYTCMNCTQTSATFVRPTDTKIGGIIGFGIRDKNMTFSIERYQSPSGPKYPANFGNGIYVASFRYAF